MSRTSSPPQTATVGARLRQAGSVLHQRLFSHFSQPGSAIGLGLFRILNSAVLQAEILQLIRHYGLIFGSEPEQTFHPENNFLPLLWVWWLTTVLFGLGMWVRPLAIVNYILTVTFLGTLNVFQYHVDYYFVGIALLFLVLPRSTAFSVRWKGAQPDGQKAASASWGYVFMLVAVGVGFVYIDSILSKLDSPMWTSGHGLYTPATIPHNTWINPAWVLDNEWLMRGLGYFALVFETIFMFLLPFQRFRTPLAAFGVVLHVGICIFFTIPWFALAVAALYAVLIPDTVWAKLLGYLRIPVPETAPHLPGTSNAPRWLASLGGAVALALVQLLCSASHRTVLRQLPEPIANTIRSTQRSVHPFARQYIGITPHGVFMDSHFANFNHFVTIVYQDRKKEIWLPLVGENGLASPAWAGRLWVSYTFRMLRAKVDPNLLAAGLRRESWHWCVRNGISLDNAQFVIRMKKVDPAFQWRKGAFQQNLASPWVDVGTLTWKKNQCSVNLPDIESL